MEGDVGVVGHRSKGNFQATPLRLSSGVESVDCFTVEEEGGGGAARQRPRPQWSLDVEAFAVARGIVKTRALASGHVGAPSPLPSTHTSQCFVFWS